MTEKNMRKGDLAVAVFAASGVIGAGIGFVAGGLSNSAIGIGGGILAFAVAFFLITESQNFKEQWEKAE